MKSEISKVDCYRYVLNLYFCKYQKTKMKTPTIRFNVEKFRAINSSDIIIDGITVVAGENGCGKSTLSKMIYYLFKTAANYELLVAKRLKSELSNVNFFLTISIRELFGNDRVLRNEFSKELDTIFYKIESEIPNDEHLNQLLIFIDKVQYSYNSQPSNISESPRNNRLKHIANDIVDGFDFDNKNQELPFEQIKIKIENIYKKAFGLIKSRSAILLTEEFENVFHDTILPSKFEVFEYDEPIVSLGKSHLSIAYSVQNVIYIDTPMMIGIDSENEYWDDLNDELSIKGRNRNQSDLLNIIDKEIIQGDTSFDDDIMTSYNFSYKRKDGSVFNLLDCATGVKSFSILQLLLKNGKINSKTLLIVDEPESHLHPQWIIEYARLLVLINKNIGTKIFIASHNPDMVSALKFISEKQQTEGNLNFYLAEKNTDFNYNYKPLGVDIEPIFESFNIAIDRINQYGS